MSLRAMIPCRHKFMLWFDFRLTFSFSRCTQALAFPAMIYTPVGIYSALCSFTHCFGLQWFSFQSRDAAYDFDTPFRCLKVVYPCSRVIAALCLVKRSMFLTSPL